uniref:Uncharacterized protein n=1 Tax=Lactuca sativa TaxID=4236 RepID=A0A9R1V3T9_LACSA|nr:hypothetical protein LSAT_V11C700365270 [Lactuca sativa]
MDMSYVVDSTNMNIEMPADATETIGMVEVVEEIFIGNPEKFRGLIEDAEKSLYKGYPNFTKLSTIIKLLNLKTKSGVSDKCFIELLVLMKNMLPEGNKMYSSTYEAKKAFKAMGSGCMC